MRRTFCLTATLLLFTGNLVAEDADDMKLQMREAARKDHRRAEITLRLIEYDPALVEELSQKDELVADRLLELWREGRGKLVKQMITVSNFESTAHIKETEEVIYPTSFKIVPGPAGSDAFAVEPADFETREVGVILDVTVNQTLQNDSFSLVAALIINYSPEWQSLGSIRNEAGKDIELLPIRKPYFRCRNNATLVQVKDGSTILLSGGYANETEDKTMFAFLTVKNVQVLDPPVAAPPNR